MSKKQQRRSSTPEEVFRTPACCEQGHAWQPTSSDTYRRCGRERCNAVQRLLNGQWVRLWRAPHWTDPRITWARRQARPRQVPLFPCASEPQEERSLGAW